MTTRVIVADSFPLFAEGVESLLCRERDIEVVARVSEADQLLHTAANVKFDVLLLSSDLANADGFALLQHFRDTKLVVLANAARDAETAARMGVAGLVLKSMPSRLLVECIRRVHAGGRWIERKSMLRVMDDLLQRDHATDAMRSQLSSREIDVIRSLARGLRNREIAETLFISEATVKVHLSHIYAKLKLRNRMALMTFAGEHHLI